MVRSEFPRAHLIELAENVGFAKANNAAFALSNAEFVLLLNPDAEIAPDGLGRMLDEARASTDVGIVGPVLVSPDGSVQYDGRRAILDSRRVLEHLASEHSAAPTECSAST